MDLNELLLSLLNPDKSLSFNVDLAIYLGKDPTAALLFACVNKNRGQAKHIDEDGFFELSMQDIEAQTTMARRRAERAIEVLVKHKIIQTKVCGHPPKMHFSLKQFYKSGFIESVSPNLYKTYKLDTPNLYKRYKLEMYKTYKLDEKPKVPPYCISTISKTNSTKYETAIQDGNTKRRYIVGLSEKTAETPTFEARALAILNEMIFAKRGFSASTKKYVTLLAALRKKGYTLDDVESVIANRRAHWLCDASGREWLRPNTLFNLTNFENYLVAEKNNPHPNTLSRLNDIELDPATAAKYNAYLEAVTKQPELNKSTSTVFYSMTKVLSASEYLAFEQDTREGKADKMKKAHSTFAANPKKRTGEQSVFEAYQKLFLDRFGNAHEAAKEIKYNRE